MTNRNSAGAPVLANYKEEATCWLYQTGRARVVSKYTEDEQRPRAAELLSGSRPLPNRLTFLASSLDKRTIYETTTGC